MRAVQRIGPKRSNPYVQANAAGFHAGVARFARLKSRTPSDSDGMSLRALLEHHWRVAAGYAVRNQRTEILLFCTLVQERIADERDERLEFSTRKMDRRTKKRLDACEHRLDRSHSVAKILVHAGLFGI